MTAQEFIKNQIKLLALNFPFGKYAYEYDKFSGIHIIQVHPIEQYESSNPYKEAEVKISVDFDNAYYPESVLFVSDNSLNQVLNPEFEIEGMFYGLHPMVKSIINPGFVNLDHESFKAGENNYALAA